MRPLVIITAVVVLAALVAGQEVSRRERLRNLISAARSGDVEARKALRSLRDKLRKRTETVDATVVQQPEPEVQPEQQTVDISEPLVESPVETLLPSKPVRQQPRERTRVLLDPHRALNRGLEIDSRSEANAVIRVTNQTKTPPIQTLRRYSYFDEQGNYIFGYEAADGSFKEEKRGLDCIVNGKYGYVDPDGVRREYTYVSGNRCDPNAPAEEDPQAKRVLNNQFLEETISEPAPTRISELSLPRVRSQASRRRRPIGAQQPQLQPEIVNIPNEVTEQISVSEPQQEILPEVIPESRPVQPEPIPVKPVAIIPKTVIPHFQIKTSEPIVPIFRPTPKPIDFDFDREFNNLFSHFGSPRPRAQVIPSPRKPQFSPPQPSLPPPPPPKIVITEKPVIAKPRPAVSQPKPANVPHQLVFDSATGTFKTIPFTTVAVIPIPLPKASGTSASSSPLVTGKPLLLSGFNPLPSVPLGSLSFKGSSVATAAQFDNFFNQFRINQ